MEKIKQMHKDRRLESKDVHIDKRETDSKTGVKLHRKVKDWGETLILIL